MGQATLQELYQICEEQGIKLRSVEDLNDKEHGVRFDDFLCMDAFRMWIKSKDDLRSYSLEELEEMCPKGIRLFVRLKKYNKLLYYDVDNKIWRCIMKAHKYWSIGAVITMFGTFCTGYKGSKTTHKYLALSSLICMVMAVYTGHKMISGNKKTKRVKQAEAVDIL